MIYLVFSTQAAAQLACDQIANNMGMPLEGVVEGKADPNAQKTSSYAVPQQILGASGTPGTFGFIPAHPLFATYPNQWAIPAPAAAALTGVTGFVSVSIEMGKP